MSSLQNGVANTNGDDTSAQHREPNGPEKPSGKGAYPQLDVPQLHSLPSEQQDLYLLKFVIGLESYIDRLEHEALCAKQGDLAEEILQIIGLGSPVPSKAIRNSLGRCYTTILRNGNRRILFESISQLCGIISTGKGEKELSTKLAAVHCLGEVYKAAGDSAINLSSHACLSVLRIWKAAQNHAGLRAAIFRALGKVIGAIKGSMEESIARDIWKQARVAAATDKAGLVQSRACVCLQELVAGTSYFDTTTDYDALKIAIWKAIESPIPNARHAAASCLAVVLIKSYSEGSPTTLSPKPKKPKKSSRNQAASLEEGEDAVSRPGSPSTKKSVTKLQLSLEDILRQLSSHYQRSTTNSKGRCGLAHCYVKILKGLKVSAIEANYGLITHHFLTELSGHASITHDRYRLLMTRRYVQHILADCIGQNILGETGRINAARILINNVLKNYPQVLKEVREPSKYMLISTLDALSSLINALGAAFNILGDSCREALVQVLQHTSYTVQIHASHCLRAFVLSCPQQLLSCASICMNSVTRELGVLTTGRQSPRRCVGYANGLAAVLSMSPSQPLYSSIEICSRVLATATQLLKSSSNEELRVAGTQVQVAWILIGGLMALGPNFVKIHLSQFLLLWRNALPKPLTKENTAQRSSAEILYLTHVRECTLGSILSFLEFNDRLITSDVAKRLGLMLQNTVEYLDNMPKKKHVEDASQKFFSSLQLQDLVLMVRRRVLQCYSRLISFSPNASGDILSQSNLLTWAVTLIADPESYTPGSLGSSIANAAGTFESIWDLSDNSAFGMTGLVRGLKIKPLPGEQSYTQDSTRKYATTESFDLDDAVSLARISPIYFTNYWQLMSPICGAQEHDSVCLYTSHGEHAESLPDPPPTELVNAAIIFFATALPLQDSRIQEGVLEQLATFLSSASLQRDPGRKAAVTVNAAMALLCAVKVANSETVAERGDLKHPAVERTAEEILRVRTPSRP